MDVGGLVDVVRHLMERRRPTVDALRLIVEGTLPAYSLPGRPGWWVEPGQLEASLAAHGPACGPTPPAGRRAAPADPDLRWWCR